MVTFADVKNNKEVQACISRGDTLLKLANYTEHSFVHAGIVSAVAAKVLEDIGGFSAREIELARIAGYMHDIGNMVNRNDHAQSGALLAYEILLRMGMDVDEVALVASAIGNHDEGTGSAVSAISAALILADKSDVRYTRVRKDTVANYDIHDRVNSAVRSSALYIDKEKQQIELKMEIDTEVSPVMDYFEIFLQRMLMCRKAAEFFKMRLRITANDMRLL